MKRAQLRVSLEAQGALLDTRDWIYDVDDVKNSDLFRR